MQAVDYEYELAMDMAGFFNNPLGFVLYAFEWGSGDLADYDGPDTWQADILRKIGEGTLTPSDAVRIAVASGHGIGKSALVSWIILWAMSTRPHLAGVVTANTAAQLSSKTWRELSIWHKRSINKHWFRWTATKFYQVDNPETWFVSAIPWSKEKPEAFAGLHSEHVLMLFDEASAIAPEIWETAEGAMTTPGAMWCAFGNPTRNSGKFFECFHKMRHRWNGLQVDSRTAKMANKAQIAEWIEDYGEDSDFARIRIKGVFPRAGSNQLISSEHVEAARIRVLQQAQYISAPKIIGVDVARFGDDQSAIIRRQGLQTSNLKKFRGLNLMQFAQHIANEIREYGPEFVFVDQGGMGAGVVDRLHELGFWNVQGIDFGSSPEEGDKYFNKRAEIWCRMRDWLKEGAIPNDPDLTSDLIAPEYGFSGDKGQILLEKKQDMKKRGLPSPDCGDALALTFSQGLIRPDVFGYASTRA